MIHSSIDQIFLRSVCTVTNLAVRNHELRECALNSWLASAYKARGKLATGEIETLKINF